MGTSSWLRRLTKAPLHALSRVCDLYVRSMTSFAVHLQYYPAVTPLPAGFQSPAERKNLEDHRELMRAASVGHARPAPAPVRKNQSVAFRAASAAVEGTRRRVAFGRIDEDEPCEYEGNDVVVGSDLLLMKSSSWAGQASRTSWFG